MSSMLTKISDINVSLQPSRVRRSFFWRPISFCGSTCPLHLQRFGNRSLGLSTQPFRKHDKRKRVQESRTNKVYRVLRIFPAGDDLFCRPIQLVRWEADLASSPRCSSVLFRDGLYHVLGS